MFAKLGKYSSLSGVKIFDGIDKKTNLPYCQPYGYDTRQVYKISNDNIFDGEIQLCKNGFHFCLDIYSASDFKNLFRSNVGKKYPNAVIMNPVFKVTAFDKVLFDEHESYGMYRCKFVTNHLRVYKQFSCESILYYAQLFPITGFAYSLLDKSTISTHELASDNANYFNRCLIQTAAKDVTIDTIPDYKHYTIFSYSGDILTVKNKTKYTHYVNRYCNTKQYIIPIPRYSTVEFKQCDIIGKLVKK